MVLVPQHISEMHVLLLNLFGASSSNLVIFLRVWKRPGVVWRGLLPLLLESPRPICRRFLRLLFSTSTLMGGPSHPEANSAIDRKDDSQQDLSLLRSRRVRLKNTRSTILVVLPPTISQLDYLFASIVVRVEHTLLKQQTLTAWWSTLGGGYFFCKRLHVSLQLARQQKILALRIGNTSMARQCQVNEAYNLIYAGKFGAAKRVLDDLEHTCEEGSLTARQCHAARLFAKRLKRARRRGLKGYISGEKGDKHTVDDFQRIRVVEG